jgi:hypothetical protein
VGQILTLEKVGSEERHGNYLIQHDYQTTEEADKGIRDFFVDPSVNYWERTTWIEGECDVESYFNLGFAIVHVETKASGTGETMYFLMLYLNLTHK